MSIRKMRWDPVLVMFENIMFCDVSSYIYINNNNPNLVTTNFEIIKTNSSFLLALLKWPQTCKCDIIIRSII